MVLRSNGYALEIDARTGALAALRAPDGVVVWSTPPGSPVWRLRFRNGSQLASTDTEAGPADLAAERGCIRVTHHASAAEVRVDYRPSRDGFDIELAISHPRADVVFVDHPALLSTDPAILRRMILPSDLGIALEPGFFRPQATPGTWTERQVGPGPLSAIAGFACRVVPQTEADATLTATPAARRMLGPALADAWTGLRRPVSRPALVGPQVDWVTSANGAYVGAHSVGQGMLVRFAGPILHRDTALVTATVRRIIFALQAGLAPTYRPQPERRCVMMIALARGPVTGGWSEPRIDAWRAAFESNPALREAGLDTRIARSVEDLQAALNDRSVLAIVNPYGECLPTGDLPGQTLVDAIRTYLQGGGIWVATGGWPFFFELRSSPYLSLDANRAVQFSDFVHVDAGSGRASLYSVQPDGGRIDVPADLRAYGSADGACLSRTWKTFVGAQTEWKAPTLRIRVAADAHEALLRYAAENRLGKPLSRKMPADVLKRWRSSVLINYEAPTFAEQMRMLPKLPAPAWLAFSNFLPLAFDKLYPDLLPPRPEVGSMEDLRALMAAIRQSGRLAAPYTNVTWWCDDPRGPTFARVGDAALLRDLQGRPVRETYGPNTGWAVSPWHPEALAASDRVLAAFVDDLGAETLFQDQIGARTWIAHDTNPASPTPYAYQEGIVRLSERTARRAPVSTEHGFDRLINVQSQFRGLTWSLVPMEPTPDWLSTWRAYRDHIDRADWEFFPLAQYVTAGHVAFGHHGGHPMVTNRTILTWSLALGYQVSLAAPARSLNDEAQRQWLLYLDLLQKTIGWRLFGQPMLDCRYLAGSGDAGVIETRFPHVRIVANLTDSPFRIDGIEVAPQGFWAEAPAAEAGILREYGGIRYEESDLWLVRTQAHGGEQFWVYTDRPVVVAGAHSRRILSPSWADDEPASPDEALPAGERTPPPERIGIVALPLPAEWRRDWSPASPEQWTAALRRTAPVRSGAVQVVALTSAAAVADALAHPEEWLAIVDAQAELLPVDAAHPRATMLAAIRRYVRRGGVWIETGGYPFWTDVDASGAPPSRTPALFDGLKAIGLSGAVILEPYQDALQVRPTAQGRDWLGAGLADRLASARAASTRPPVSADYEVKLIECSDGAPLLIASQLRGWGLFVRFCGNLGADLTTEAARTLIERWWTRTPERLPPAPGAWELVTDASAGAR